MLETAITELSRHLSGYVLQPGEAEYESAVKIDNGRIDLRPRLIVRPTVVDDVAKGLKFAKEHELAFTIKGGGHSAAGYCLNDGGMVMDMKHLKKISFNREKETITAEMGVIWRDLYNYMAATGTGLIPIGGGCPTVAPPGFMQGGGYSFVSRSYGMSIDNLEQITIVTPDGELRCVGKQSTNPYDVDLFWAIRGGGGGNFGIVVEMEMNVRKPNTELMLVGQIRYPLELADEVLGYYNEWVEEIPNSMACYGYMGGQPDPVTGKNVKVLGLTPVFNGNCAEGMDLLSGLLKMKYLNADLKNMTLPDWELFNGNTTLVENRSAYIRSAMLPPGGMNNKVANTIKKYIGNAPSEDSFAVWTLGGGAISEKASDDTAFYFRDTRFIPEIKSIWDLDKPGDAVANVEWAYEFFEQLGHDGGSTGAYVNYIDPLLHNWKEKYYGDNYARLEKIKKAVDPNNYLAFQQGIGSSFNPDNPKDLSPLNRTLDR